MSKPLLVLTALLSVLAPLASPAAQPGARQTRDTLAVATDRSDALYRRGETATFVLTLQIDGQPAAGGEVEWTLTKDGYANTGSGRAAIDHGRATVKGMLDEPGFLQCRASFASATGKLTAVAGAGFSPLAIKPSAPPPEDFDAFWAARKRQLAAVPPNLRLTPVPSGVAGVDAFDLQADCVGAPVSGYLARPAGAKPHTLPAVLTVHGAGVGSSTLGAATGWARDGALALDINAHGLPNRREKAFYDALAAGELKDYRIRGRESRDRVYFLGMFQRLIRAIDALTAQPEWDGRILVVSGSSQGGFQAIAAAGLDSRVTFFVAGVPAGCDHTGSLAGRIAGWPKFIPTGEKATAEVVNAVRYFDNVNFAARARAPGFFTVGFIDTTCPPTSVYAAYNALTSPKEIFNDIMSPHTNTPAARAKMRAAVLRHFETARANQGR